MQSTHLSNSSSAPIAPGTASLWWLGQGSFVFEGATGGPLVIDPYLSDSVAKDGGPGRLHPVPVEPGDLRVNAIFLTHDHIDHTDPDSMVPLAAANPDALIFAPDESVAHLARLEITGARVHALNRGQSVVIPGATVHALHAEHTDDSVGLVVIFDGGPTIYHTADTLFVDQLAEAARFQPDLMTICINGRWGNMNIAEAVQVTKMVMPRAVVPMHWGLFAENTADPHEFVRELAAADVNIPATVLEPGVGRMIVKSLAAE